MFKSFALNMSWIVAAAVAGFVITFVFAGLLRLPRNLFLVAYVGLVVPFLYAFYRFSSFSLAELIRRNWYWGLLSALIFGAFVVKNVFSQPGSPTSSGLTLAFDILWSGVVYGAVDALFLSVLPVLAVWQAFSQLGTTATLPGKILVGFIAILASLLVTIAYHLGYPEYRGSQVSQPVIGNGVMTLGYLLANNPIAAVFSHIAMHVAGVLHGPATVVQLPPHYVIPLQ